MNSRLRPALILVAVLLGVAILAPALAPYAPTEQFDMATMRTQPPSPAHLLGTDAVARDVLSRLLHGARTSIGIALLAVLVALTLGTTVGVTAALGGRITEALLMRFTDAALSFPRILALLLCVASLDDPLPPAGFALLLGCTGWMNTARLIRQETGRLLATEYLKGAEALGVPWPRLVRRHLLPGLLPTLVAAGSIAFASAIPLEAGLSFLGLGVQLPHPSWGNIITEAGGRVVHHWWLVLFPTAAIVGTALAATRIAERTLPAIGSRR